MSTDARVASLLDEVGVTLDPAIDVTLRGTDPVLPSSLAIGEAAAVAIGACSATAAQLWADRTGEGQHVDVDVALAAASLISFILLRVEGGATPIPTREREITRLWPCRDDRWFHLHGGLSHLLEGTLAVLGCELGEVRETMAKLDAFELEERLAAAGMCGAVARTAEEWATHPQHAAARALGRVSIDRIGDAEPEPVGDSIRPLGGVRTLDLTRMLAGPIAGRTLAEHGADVLLINSPSLENPPLFVIDTGHGKRSAHLDLNDEADVVQLRSLAAGADVFTQGYRSGGLARRGLGPDEVAELRPGIVYVSVNCYGDAGPWRERPGWEQLAEATTGMSIAQGSFEHPEQVTAAPCDYITGSLAALGAMAALRRRARDGGSWHVRVSLVQTAHWLMDGPRCDKTAAAGIDGVAAAMVADATDFGRVTHLPPISRLSATPPRWDRVVAPLGTDPPRWF